MDAERANRILHIFGLRYREFANVEAAAEQLNSPDEAWIGNKVLVAATEGKELDLDVLVNSAIQERLPQVTCHVAELPVDKFFVVEYDGVYRVYNYHHS